MAVATQGSAAIMVNQMIYSFGGSKSAAGSSWTQSDDMQYWFISTSSPTTHPTSDPTPPSMQPSVTPTASPTIEPTSDPTKYPTFNPTNIPSSHPTVYPSIMPTTNPTSPTSDPTIDPTLQPTLNPSTYPTFPTYSPTTARPSLTPTAEPTSDPEWILASSSMPRYMYSSAIGYHNSTIYLIGGRSSPGLMEYGMKSNTWSWNQSFFPSDRDHQIGHSDWSVQFDDTVYLADDTNLHIFHLESKEFIYTAGNSIYTMPISGDQVGCLAGMNGLLYYIGGRNDESGNNIHLSTLQIFDVDSLLWTLFPNTSKRPPTTNI